MRKTLIALALSALAAPAFAGGGNFDMPHLIWPSETATVTGSTMGCIAAPQSGAAAPACK